MLYLNLNLRIWKTLSHLVDLTLQGGNVTRHDLVEDMVGTFQGLLGDDTSLLKQVWNIERLHQ